MHLQGKFLGLRSSISAAARRSLPTPWACASPRKMAAAAAPVPAGAAEPEPADPIVMYVIMRKDLWADQSWPLGPIIAQACHASSAALWLHRDDEVTALYCAPESIDHMHKVLILQSAAGVAV